MVKIVFIDCDGNRREVDGVEGQSVMRCATDHLIPGIVGECGGGMACATCHGYVDEAWRDRLPAPGEQEREMAQGCLDARPESRLTCQIRLTAALDGLVIRTPRSQT